MNQTTIPTDEALACLAIENGLKGRLKKLKRGLIRLDEDDGSIKHKKPLVSCFCEERDNPLMWGHYANSQKGVCIGYKAQLINGEYKLTLDLEEEAFLKVKYRKQPPRRINLFGPDAETKTCLFVLTKFSKWKYENEYRIVLVKDKDKQKNKKTYEKKDIECIIFGSKVDYCDAHRIYKVIKENYLKKGINIKFYRALETPGKYELKIDLIPNMSDYIQSFQ